jgi:hypothetical protein
MCQLIDLRHLPVGRGLIAIARRQLAIVCGLGTFLGRSGAIVRRSGAIVRRPPPIVPSPDSLLFLPAELGGLGTTILRLGTGVPRLSHLIACRGQLSTPVRGEVSRSRGRQASASLSVAKLGCAIAPRGAAIQLTKPLRGFPIAGDLVLFRGRLVTIRGRLIPIRSRLITVGCCLILP